MTDQSSLPRYLDVLDGVIILAAINDRGEYLPLPAESIERKLTGELREYMRDDKVKHVVISDRQDIELVKALIPKHVSVTQARMFCDVILSLGFHFSKTNNSSLKSKDVIDRDSLKEYKKIFKNINDFLHEDAPGMLKGPNPLDFTVLSSYINDLLRNSFLLSDAQRSILAIMVESLEVDLNNVLSAIRMGKRSYESKKEEEMHQWIQESIRRYLSMCENYKKNARRFLKSLAEGL